MNSLARIYTVSLQAEGRKK